MSDELDECDALCCFCFCCWCSSGTACAPASSLAVGRHCPRVFARDYLGNLNVGSTANLRGCFHPYSSARSFVRGAIPGRLLLGLFFPLPEFLLLLLPLLRPPLLRLLQKLLPLLPKLSKLVCSYPLLPVFWVACPPKPFLADSEAQAELTAAQAAAHFASGAAASRRSSSCTRPEPQAARRGEPWPLGRGPAEKEPEGRGPGAEREHSQAGPWWGFRSSSGWTA